MICNALLAWLVANAENARLAERLIWCDTDELRIPAGSLPFMNSFCETHIFT